MFFFSPRNKRFFAKLPPEKFNLFSSVVLSVLLDRVPSSSPDITPLKAKEFLKMLQMDFCYEDNRPKTTQRSIHFYQYVTFLNYSNHKVCIQV